MKKIIALLSFVLLVGTASAQEEKMTYEVYLQELAKHKQREEAAKSKIATLESEIATLRQQIEDTKSKIKSTWQAMLDHVGITQEEYDAFVQRIDDFTSRVRNFQNQFADDHKAWASAITGAETEFVEIKSNKIAAFPRLDGKIAEAGQAIEDSKSALEVAKNSRKSTSTDSYTVRLIPERRDCLWRIAEYSEIYNDPFQWPKIYSANKDQIKDPDLIYPGQVFQIPR